MPGKKHEFMQHLQLLHINLQKITCFTAAILFTPGFAIPSPFFLSYLEIALKHSPYGWIWVINLNCSATLVSMLLPPPLPPPSNPMAGLSLKPRPVPPTPFPLPCLYLVQTIDPTNLKSWHAYLELENHELFKAKSISSLGTSWFALSRLLTMCPANSRSFSVTRVCAVPWTPALMFSFVVYN